MTPTGMNNKQGSAKAAHSLRICSCWSCTPSSKTLRPPGLGGLATNRPVHAEFDAVYYADDTICVSANARALSALIKAIEIKGDKCGMKLNYAKCELLKTGPRSVVRFKDESPMKTAEEARYLGIQLNSKSDSNKEVQQRVNTLTAIKKNSTFSGYTQTSQPR